MSLQDSFVTPVSSCMNPNFKFPSLTEPGMPSFVLGAFMATLAGINYALQFIVPTPKILPNIKPPTIDLFLKAFTSSLKLPGLTIPMTVPPFDISGALKLIQLCIQLPFQLIVKLIDGLLSLQINLPTLSGIQALGLQIAQSVGLQGPIISNFIKCIAESIIDLFSALV